MNDDEEDPSECTIVEVQTVLLETMSDGTEQDRLDRAFTNVTGTYVAKRSTALLMQNDPLFLERLFPHLLTFGIGGFSTARQHRYSQRAVVLHYLNLSSNRFAEDPLFKLAMFYFLSTMRVKTGIYLRVGQDPAIATTTMRVIPDQLKTAMNNRVEQRKAWKRGHHFSLIAESNLASRVLKSINASTSKMWGSNEEREALIRKVDAMTILYGAPSVFWTLTPNPDCSLTCAFWSGHQLPNGRPNHLTECLETNMPCASKMKRLIMTNTVVQATYYKVCCHVLIDVLFGWDMTANKPKSRRGIFGYVEAYLYALEQQGRLFIHHHGVAWIAGLPKTQADWERLLDNAYMKDRFQRYCASIFAAELPIFDAVAAFICPRANCGGELKSIAIPKKYNRLLKPSTRAPLVANCSRCEINFSEEEIISAELLKQWNELDADHKAVSSPCAVESIRHRLGGLSKHKPTAAVQLSRLLLKDQIHSYTHAHSCIKGRTTTKCRYNFFRKTVEATGFDGSNNLKYRRRMGNQWVNTFIPLWRRVFHFNIDARILWSGQSLQATRYALQYTMKQQSVLDNVAVVEMVFKKRVDREQDLTTSSYAKGVGRLLSLAYATSGVMEVGGPLATAIIMEGEVVSFSCKFERLVILEGLSLLADTEVEAVVVTRHHQLYTETSIGKYMERPKCLEHYCWYDYCCWFTRNGSPQSLSNHCGCFVTTDELREHVKKHNLRLSHYPHAPEIIGPRLPDITRLADDDYNEKAEIFYRMTILLYHPFRSLDGILDSTNSAKMYFEAWNPLRDENIARALDHHQQFYIGLAMAREYREKQRLQDAEHSDDEELDHDQDIQHQALTWDPPQSRVANDYVTVALEVYFDDLPLEDDADIDTDTQSPDQSHEVSHTSTVLRQLLLHAITSSQLPHDYSGVLRVSGTSITRAQMSQHQSHAMNSPQINPANARGDREGTTELLVERFECATRDLSYNGTQPTPTTIQPYASIRDVSSKYQLNSSQHLAFTLVAMPLLSKIAGVPISQDSQNLFNDAPIVITGAGGTGKSQVIGAVRGLVTSWGCPGAVMVVASTGIAAASLQGNTMHSSVGLGINATRLPKHISTPNDNLLRQWAPVLCVIADELSMVDLSFFGLWEEVLRHAKENLTEDYGGLLTVLMFDHCQLRTVRGTPIYKTVSNTAPLSPAQDRGRRLYQSISKVVYFTQNMRFAADPEWGRWLASARIGNWDADLRSFIENMSNFNALQPPIYNGLIQTISTDNETRTDVNDTAIAIAIHSLPQDHKVFVIPARLSRRVSAIEMATVRNLPDNKTGNIPVFQHLYVGMPVRIKANQCVASGVANGASGILHHIDWAPNTAFTQQPNGASLASTQPTNIFVNIANNPNTTRLPLLPPHWPTSVMPVCQATAQVKIKGPTLSIKGYPIVPAFGTTVHGVQGETKDIIAITNLRPPTVPSVDPHALYVALSRVRTRHGLYWVGQRPSAADFNYFRPSTEVLMEDTRLRRPSDATVENFKALTHSNQFRTVT